MRLIDADALQAEYKERHNGKRLLLIDVAPTIEPDKHTKERTETHARDLIDRQKAIEVLDKIFPVDPMRNDYTQGIACGAALATEYIKQLPSAEPEIDEWCTDCKEYDSERHCCPRWNRVIRETLKDAQTERKTGKWIDRSGGMASSWNYCSVCGNQQIYRYDFCPDCGADMRGEQDGSD